MSGIIEKATLTSIANAIREKKKVTTKYKPREMADAILSIEVATPEVSEYQWKRYNVTTGWALNYTDEIIRHRINHSSVEYRCYKTATASESGIALSDGSPLLGLSDRYIYAYPFYTYNDIVYKTVCSTFCRKVTSEQGYIKGEYIDTVTSSNKYAYPIDGVSGSYWYEAVTERSSENYILGTAAEIDVINNSIKKIGAYSFCDDFALKSIECPYVTTVGEHAFDGCGNIIGIKLPLVTDIGNYAFANCVGNYKKLDFNNLQSIGSFAFLKPGSFTTLILRGNSVCSVQSTSFYEADFTLYVYVPAAMLESYQADTTWAGISKVTFRTIEAYPDICGG